MFKKILFVTIIIGAVFSSCSRQSADNESVALEDTVAIDMREKLFDLPVDEYVIEKHIVRKREKLANILLRAGVPMATILEIDQKARNVFSFNNLRAGNAYTLFFTTDTLRELKHFVYEIDQCTHLRCSIDPMEILLINRTITTRECQASAIINTSLWNAASESGLPPMLAIEISDIFAWAIDFFGIEKGDYFKVIYDESYSDSTFLGVDKIKAAMLMHRGEAYYAFRFEQDTTFGYYDLEGNNLHRAFLKAPLKYSRISSKFSKGRVHPILKIKRAHYGVDYVAPQGTPVYTIGDGEVIARGWDSKGGGNYVKIRHNSIYTSCYMHLRGFAKGIKKGKKVKQGDVIGYVGKTGMATGPHLDFRIFQYGKPIDPLKMEAPPIEPIDNDVVQEFIEYSDSLRNILDNLPLKIKKVQQ